MILDTTSKSLRVYLGSAATTTNPVFSAAYVDHTTSSCTPGANDGAADNTTAVTVVAAPASSTQRQVKAIDVWNGDTISHQVTVELLNSATQRTLIRATLEPMASLHWAPDAGWYVLTAEGAPRLGGVVSNQSRLMRPVCAAVTANITGTKTCTSNASWLVYVGVASRAASQVTLRYNVTTAAATITWCEAAVFKGTPLVAANPSLSRLGYADVSGVINSTGRKSTTVSLTTNVAVGDELWVGVGCQATTAAVVRAYSLVEDCQVGSTVTLAASRYSTVASPTSWTVDNAVAQWIYAYLV
jgi:hypothetical protein